MFEFKKLRARYLEDAAFNQAVNLFRQLTEQYGFLPDELRQAAFLAQYMIQIDAPQEIIRTQEEWRQLAEMRVKMQQMLIDDYPALAEKLKVHSRGSHHE